MSIVDGQGTYNVAAEPSVRTSTITEVSTLRAAVPLGSGRGGSGSTQVDLYLVQITTDDGGTGSGFTYSLSGAGEGIAAVLEHTVTQSVTGTTLAAWPQTARRLVAQSSRIGSTYLSAAISAVDIAVHDTRARQADQPLYQYLGAHRDAIPIYGSGRATHQMSTDELVTGSETYMAEGFDAVKLRVGVRPAAEDLERVTEVRNALGSTVQVMIDANERLDVLTAAWLARRFDELGIYWFEEPLPSSDVEGHRHLANLGPPIAVGEHLHNRFEFANYLRAGAARVLQPDAPLTGGLSEWLRIATIAEVSGAIVSPHFLPELHIHVALAVSNCPYIEHFPLLDDVLRDGLLIQGGLAYPPHRPGHGMLWDFDALDRYRVS